MGLVFSAASAAYTALAFNAQTAQQKQQAAADAGAQAARVNVWWSDPAAPNADEQAFIDNTSALPLYQGTLYFKELPETGYDDQDKYGTVRLVSLGIVPPCTRMTIDLTKALADETADRPQGHFDQLTGLQLDFWDAAGLHWIRDTGTVLESISQPRLLRASSRAANGLAGPDRWGGTSIPSEIEDMTKAVILGTNLITSSSSPLCQSG